MSPFCLTKGQLYYLYMVIDVWSRRIFGAELYERESGQLARVFLSVFADTKELTRSRQPFCTPTLVPQPDHSP